MIRRRCPIDEEMADMLLSPMGRTEIQRTPDRPNRPSRLSVGGKVLHKCAASPEFTSFAENLTPLTPANQYADPMSGYEVPDMSPGMVALQISPLRTGCQRGGLASAQLDSGGSSLTDLPPSFPSPSPGRAPPVLHQSEHGPRATPLWQDSPRRTSQALEPIFPWSPYFPDCSLLSPVTSPVHGAFPTTLKGPDQAAGLPAGLRAELRTADGTGPDCLADPEDSARPQQVENTGTGCSAPSEAAMHDTHRSQAMTLEEIHPAIAWGLKELSNPGPASDFPCSTLAQDDLQRCLRGYDAKPGPTTHSSESLEGRHHTPAEALVRCEADQAGLQPLPARPSSSQVSTYSNTIPAAFLSATQPGPRAMGLYPSVDEPGASPSALLPMSRPPDAVVGSFSPDFVHTGGYNQSTPPGMTPSQSVVPPKTPGDEKSAMAASSGAGNRRVAGISAGRWANRRCNCKKSKCLKLYCDCFAAGQFCGNCSCSNCQNNAEHREIVESTRGAISQRNPQAFVEKISKVTSAAGHRRGCNCKKSNCKKKYCECYQAGVNCGPQCKCEACQNTPEDGLPPFHPDEYYRNRSKAAQVQEQTKTSPGTPNAPSSGALPVGATCLESRGSLAEQRTSSRSSARQARRGSSLPGQPLAVSQAQAELRPTASPLFVLDEVPDGGVHAQRLSNGLAVLDSVRDSAAAARQTWQNGSAERNSIPTSATPGESGLLVCPSTEGILQPIPGGSVLQIGTCVLPGLYGMSSQPPPPTPALLAQSDASIDIQNILAGSAMLQKFPLYHQFLVQQGQQAQRPQAASDTLQETGTQGPILEEVHEPSTGMSAPALPSFLADAQPLAHPTPWTEHRVNAVSRLEEPPPVTFYPPALAVANPPCRQTFAEAAANMSFSERENRSGLANLLPRTADTLSMQLEASAQETAEQLLGTSFAGGIFKRPVTVSRSPQKRRKLKTPT